MTPMSIGLSLGGYVGLVIMAGLYVGAREDLASERERCNTDKVTAVSEAERVTRKAVEAAFADRLAKEAARANREAVARAAAEESAQAADARPPKIRTVIKEVASANACINVDLPAALVNSLRD